MVIKLSLSMYCSILEVLCMEEPPNWNLNTSNYNRLCFLNLQPSICVFSSVLIIFKSKMIWKTFS